MPTLRYCELMKHALLTPVTACGLVLLSMENAKAEFFNTTIVEDLALSHLARVDYKAPIVVRGVASSPDGSLWRWVLLSSDLAMPPDGSFDDLSADGNHKMAPHPELGELDNGHVIVNVDNWNSTAPGDTRPLWADNFQHDDGFHVDWLQMRVDRIGNGVSRIWLRFDHLSPGEAPPPLPPPQTPPTAIGIRYFRGTCTVGAVGAPCNVGPDCGGGGVCGVTTSNADDVTIVSDLPGPVNDLYRGQIGPGIGIGTLAYPNWILNVASCWNPPFGDWIAPDTGFMDQGLDPNPGIGRATFYDYTTDAGFGPPSNVNDLGCSSPSMCSNTGWCEVGPSAGAPCNADADCVPGVCTIKATLCKQHGGSAAAAGCSSHHVCVGGANVGRLCGTSADCLGSQCVAPTLPAGFCANVSLSPGPIDENGCPPLGDPNRITRVVPVAVIAACP